MKFVKYIWDEYAYVIVQPMSDTDARCEDLLDTEQEQYQNGSDRSWGKLIYGSKVKYSKSGRVFFFRNIKAIEELDYDEVVNEHFVGLI